MGKSPPLEKFDTCIEETDKKGLPRVTSLPHMLTDGKSMLVNVEGSDNDVADEDDKEEIEKAVIKKWRKTLTPSKEDLAKLVEFLNPDKNEIEIQLSNGEPFIKSYLYLFKHDEKIVISDIDGTVTKSDGLGHLLPRLGLSDWSHQGIAAFYTNIWKNGYKLVYLSSRPVGFSGTTRKYIDSIKQDNCHMMPSGPILLSPDRTSESLYREIIIKKPHIFKIECLKTVRALFPDNEEPFYAGFGNRDTDYVSYKTLGLNVNRIYIINSNSQIKNLDQAGFVSSYDDLNNIAEYAFPCVDGLAKGYLSENYNEKNFWNPTKSTVDIEN